MPDHIFPFQGIKKTFVYKETRILKMIGKNLKIALISLSFNDKDSSAAGMPQWMVAVINMKEAIFSILPNPLPQRHIKMAIAHGSKRPRLDILFPSP